MSGTPLELAAFACLAVGVVALFIRVGGPSWSRRVCILRFRRKLKGIDAVLGAWAEEVRRHEPRADYSGAESGSDPVLRLRALELGEDEPPAAAAC